MEILGYIAAIAVGIILGLIGGGGSILSLPILVYLFNIQPTLATSYSLFIVGVSASVGVFSYFTRKEVDIRSAIVFFLPSLITVYTTREFIFPLLPEICFSASIFEVRRDVLLLSLFALLMISSSVSMIRSGNTQKTTEEDKKKNVSAVTIAVAGAGVGFITGFFGAGGGFMIIPALTLLANMPMRTAVGTSLFIIATNTLFGFLGDIGDLPIDWIFLSFFTAFALGGILIGSRLSATIPASTLKKAFGWFVLAMGLFIITKEVFNYID